MPQNGITSSINQRLRCLPHRQHNLNSPFKTGPKYGRKLHFYARHFLRLTDSRSRGEVTTEFQLSTWSRDTAGGYD